MHFFCFCQASEPSKTFTISNLAYFKLNVCQTNSKVVASMLALKSFKDDARRNWKGRLFDNMAFILKRKLHLKLSAITFLGES